MKLDKDFGSNAKIIRFASGGPKNYGYVIEKDGQLIEKIKVKGITITNEIKDIINYDLIERFAGEFMLNSPQQINLKQLQFGSRKRSSCIHKIFSKLYRVVSDKRIVLKEPYFHSIYQTIPFGYKIVSLNKKREYAFMQI